MILSIPHARDWATSSSPQTILSGLGWIAFDPSNESDQELLATVARPKAMRVRLNRFYIESLWGGCKYPSGRPVDLPSKWWGD